MKTPFACALILLVGCNNGGAVATDVDGGGGDLGSEADLVTSPSLDSGLCTATITTAGIGCSYAHDALNNSPSVNAESKVAWACAQGQRTVTGNGLPDHDVGTFPNPNCPNTISAQNVSASMTLTPVSTGTANRVQPSGYAWNGVKFDPGTAGTCTENNGQTSCSLIGNTGSWNIEALGQSSFDFGVDSNNAHVQPTGAYHYHGMPTGLIANLGKGQAMTLVGFAMDGFPIYARYGYSNANDATSAIKVITSSYRLKATPDANRPPTSTYPMGAFSEDYEYVAGLGDLDECNGRTGVTPEFPCGIYHYYITDTYPFIQRCVKGTAQNGGGGMGPRNCTSGADCAGACPPGSKGCGCATTPMGMMCIPTCGASSDCPAGPMGGALQCRNGFCVP